MLRTTQAQYSILASHFDQYKQALAIATPATRLRLLVAMTNLVGSFNLPTDVLDEFDSRIGDAYDCEGFTLNAPKVIYTAFEGTVIVDSLHS